MFQFALKQGREIDVLRSFLTKLDLFKRKPDLVDTGRYAIKSNVDSDVFVLFMTRLCGATSDARVTPENAEQLLALCDELGFSGFDDELRAVLGRGADMNAGLEELQRRVLELERQLQEVRALPQRVRAVEQRLAAADWVLDDLQRRDASNDVESLRREVMERASAVDVKALSDEVSRLQEAEAKRDAGDMRKDVESLRREVRERASAADVRALSDEVSRLKEAEAKRAKGQTRQSASWAEVEVPASKATTLDRNQFVYDSSKPLDGIIAHLTRECGGNVHKKGVVKVTASSCDGDYGKPEHAVDLTSDWDFYSGDEPNSWICYDFGGQRVTPTSYSIRSKNDGPGSAHPRSWVLEVSNDETDIGSDPRRRNLGQFLRITPDGHAFHVDGKKWVVVDRRKDNFDLNDRHVTRNFGLSTPPSGAFRFVRLRLTGKNHHGDDYLRIGALELFGALSSQ